MTFAERIANALATGVLLSAGSLATAGISVAQVFECGFFQENAKDGKANRASCTMYPDKVFKTASRTPDRRDHCIVEPINGMEELQDVIVDIGNGNVSWTSFYHLSDHAQKEFKDFHMKEKSYPEGSASRRSAPEVRTRYDFKLTVAHDTVKEIGYDRKLEKVLQPPRRVIEHTILFENAFWKYVLYIPEDSGESVLTEFNGTGEHSWVNIRFGNCRRKSE